MCFGLKCIRMANHASLFTNEVLENIAQQEGIEGRGIFDNFIKTT